MQLFVQAASHAKTLIDSEPTASVGAVCDAYARVQGLAAGGQRVSGLHSGALPCPLCSLLAPQRVCGGLRGRLCPPPQRVVYAGRTLDEGSTLAAAGVAAYGTLELLPRLRGGGGDGGATGAESRSCYLEMYAERKPDKVRRWLVGRGVGCGFGQHRPLA